MQCPRSRNVWKMVMIRPHFSSSQLQTIYYVRCKRKAMIPCTDFREICSYVVKNTSNTNTEKQYSRYNYFITSLILLEILDWVVSDFARFFVSSWLSNEHGEVDWEAHDTLKWGNYLVAGNAWFYSCLTNSGLNFGTSMPVGISELWRIGVRLANIYKKSTCCNFHSGSCNYLSTYLALHATETWAHSLHKTSLLCCHN